MTSNFTPKQLGRQFDNSVGPVTALSSDVLPPRLSFEHWMEQGDNCYFSGDYNGARQNYMAAVQARPDNSRALFFLGLEFLRLNEPGIAERFMARSVEQQPHSAFPYIGLGLTLLKAKPHHSGDAEAAFAAALRRFPEQTREIVGLIDLDASAAQIVAQLREKDDQLVALPPPRVIKPSPKTDAGMLENGFGEFAFQY